MLPASKFSTLITVDVTLFDDPYLSLLPSILLNHASFLDAAGAVV